MNIILTNYSRKGIYSLRQLCLFRFCTSTPFSGRRNHDNNLLSKLSEKLSLKVILDLYESKQDEFLPEHYALACRSIGKSFQFERNKLEITNDPIIAKFGEKLNSIVEELNDVEITDVMFLLRKQKSEDFRFFNINYKTLTTKINHFVETEAFTLANLISVYASMAALGMNTFAVANSLLKRLTDSTNSEFDKPIPISLALELVSGVTHKGHFLNSVDRRLVSETIKRFNKTFEHQKNQLSFLVNLLKNLAKVNVIDPEVLSFINKAAEILRGDKEISLNQVLSALDLGALSNNYPFTKIALDMKKTFFETIAEDKKIYNMSSVVKVLTRLADWQRNNYLTPEQETIVLDFFENNYEEFLNYDFSRSPPRFLRLFNKSSSMMIVDTILEGYPHPSIYLLHAASKYTNVIPEFQTKGIDVNQNLDLNDLLKMDFILRDDGKNTPALAQFKTNINQLIKKKLHENFHVGAIKGFIRDTPTYYQRKIKNFVKEEILTFPEEKFNSFLKKPEFIYVLMNVFYKNYSEIKERVEAYGVNKIFNSRILNSLIRSFADSDINLNNVFWSFVQAFNVDTRDILYAVSFEFLQRSIRSLDHSSDYVRWLKSVLFNSTLIDNHLFALITETLQSSSNPIANRVILETFISNIDKCSRVQKSQVIKIIRILKKEGLLDANTTRLIFKKFQFLERDAPIFMTAFNKENENFLRIVERTKSVNFGLVEIFLLFDIELWKAHQANVLKFIEKEEFPLKKWKALISSIRSMHRRNPEYRNITNTLMTKFLKEVEDKDGVESITLLERISEISPETITRNVVEDVKKRLFSTTDFQVAEIYLGILNNIGNNHVIEQFFNDKTELSISGKTKLAERLNIRFNSTFAKTLIENFAKASNNREKADITNALLLNDHLPEVQAFIKENAGTIAGLYFAPIAKAYFKLKYQGIQNELTDKKSAFQGKFYSIDKVKQMVEKASLDFQVSPVVNNYEMSFRIGDKYFIGNPSRNFMYLPFRNKDNSKEKPDFNLDLFTRMLEVITGKTVVPVPTSGKALYIILRREVPQLNAIQNDKKKEEVEEEQEQEVEELNIKVNPVEQQVEIEEREEKEK